MYGFRSWLILGRVSNLTTVWANALCAWTLGGAGAINDLIILIFGLSLFYIGGMYLNDYCDTEFDYQHRPERPIVSGKIKQHVVLAATILVFVLGTAFIVWVSKDSLIYALILLTLIVSYNLIHKHHALIGVFLMGSCRSVVYLVAGAASTEGINLSIQIAAILMFFYISGITVLARNESFSLKTPVISYVLLIVPLMSVLYIAGPYYEEKFLISFCLVTLWVILTFCRARKKGTTIPGKAVSPLLAGICLIDLAILSSMYLVEFSTLGLFLGFFAIALLAQRYVPAT